MVYLSFLFSACSRWAQHAETIANEQSLGGVSTLTRISLSLLPISLFSWAKSVARIRKFEHYKPRPTVSDLALALHADPSRRTTEALDPAILLDLDQLKKWDDYRLTLEKRRVRQKRLLSSTILFPVFIFLIVLGAGLERVPITGRLRMILLSPTEEKALHDGLKEMGWLESVIGMLIQEGENPKLLASDDPRWAWVEKTLRQLEKPIVTCDQLDHKTSSAAPPPIPFPYTLPPPALYHLHPRPRVSLALAESTGAVPVISEGPPFQVLLLDGEEPNAFSFGFGSRETAGIVVYRGLLDEILGSSSAPAQPSAPSAPKRPLSLSSIFSTFFASSSRTTSSSASRAPFEPTPDQTLHLAAVLSHELSHLILSHHLESLSLEQVLLPSAMSLFADLLRTILFPITFFAGPFVNDSLASMSKVGASGITECGTMSSSRVLEIEADVVALRCLASAGFNPYDAARFWAPDTSAPAGHVHRAGSKAQSVAWRSSGSSHPDDIVRSKAVRDELERWEAYRAEGAGAR